MCGRYQFDNNLDIAELQRIVEQLNKGIAAGEQPSRMKTGEIFPTDIVPVIAYDDQQEHPLLMNWGFPKWDTSGVIINARAETIDEKPLFRDSFHKRRCLIPSTGFFEWQHHEGSAKKQKYLLRLIDTPLLYMAGIYNLFTEADGTMKTAFAIVTTDANASVSPIHNRMPLILEGAYKDAWLRNTSDAIALLHRPSEAQLILLATG
jgi:putative SOS response-associated peptidase YedK